MATKREPPRLMTGAARKFVRLAGSNSSDHTKSSRVIQLPSIYVGIEPARHHGWNIVARRRGRIVLHDRCVALLSVAVCEAAELAQLRGWRLAS